MSDSPTPLDRLEALAKAATPGPWTAFYNSHGDPFVNDENGGWGTICKPGTGPDDYGRANTEFIAAADPTTILALVAQVSRLTETLRAAQEWFREGENLDLIDVVMNTPLAAALESPEPPSPTEWVTCDDAECFYAGEPHDHPKSTASRGPVRRPRAAPSEPPSPHECHNCLGVDPSSCAAAPSEPPSDPEPDCGHRCCSERSYKYHAHWLSPEECPHCAAEPKASE